MMPDQWASYMAANPGWWLLSREERRARARMAYRNEHRQRGVPNIHGNFVSRQGLPPMPPVVVPTSLIWPDQEPPRRPLIADQRRLEAEEFSRLVAEESKRRHPDWPDVRRFPETYRKEETRNDRS